MTDSTRTTADEASVAVKPTEPPAAEPPHGAPVPPSPTQRVLRTLGRLPFTIALLATLVLVGILVGGFVSSVSDADWYETFAYGVPSFADGRWWTTITGTFLVADPWGYLVLLLTAVGVGWLEFRRGTGRAAAHFFGGQVLAVIGAAVVIAGFAEMGSHWAETLVTQVDVGPSGGVFACIAAAAASLPSPWRGRALLILTAFTLVSVLFLGTVADVEHAMAVGMVLLVNAGSFTKPTVREQRYVAFVMIIALTVVQVIASIAPTYGPFGMTSVGGIDMADVLIDAIVVLVIAPGLLRGYRVAMVIAVILAGVNVLAGALAVFLIVHPELYDDAADYDSREGLAFAAASGFLWAVMLVWLTVCRRAFRARLRRRLPGDKGLNRPGVRIDDVRRIVQQDGGGALSWMATWRDNRHFFGSDPTTVVAYQTHHGVALVLGDPIAPPEKVGATLTEFIDSAERAGFVVCVFSAGAAVRDAMPEGWRALQIAEDTIVDLPGLEFTGKKWGAVRTAINRGARDDVTFRLTTLSSEPRSVRAQITEISEQWVGDKGLPEMRFTLGSIDEALDPAVRTAIATAADGTVQGFLSWLPVYAPGGRVRGWTLDLMRRRDGGSFPPVMEFLIGSSALAFRDEGAEFLSLSGAPLARSEDPEDERQIEVILDRLGGILEPAYGFRSLHRFKQKFNPRAEPMYLLYSDGADLARIGIALVRAYLPDASVPQLVRAGLTMGK
ncbi:bifunctional lysylphosphatidylglycerol flippase/synthetase MprF [Agromyces sp. NPDC058110]|uniref:bifunctional lysylphosphatidylglycerol flippase/synthetase MprF n=1 Tax=Agromyces sp. NPDC058110 TaxID=3346345 RepID=UPI0036DCED14